MKTNKKRRSEVGETFATKYPRDIFDRPSFSKLL